MNEENKEDEKKEFVEKSLLRHFHFMRQSLKLRSKDLKVSILIDLFQISKLVRTVCFLSEFAYARFKSFITFLTMRERLTKSNF